MDILGGVTRSHKARLVLHLHRIKMGGFIFHLSNLVTFAVLCIIVTSNTLVVLTTWGFVLSPARGSHSLLGEQKVSAWGVRKVPPGIGVKSRPVFG